MNDLDNEQKISDWVSLILIWSMVVGLCFTVYLVVVVIAWVLLGINLMP